MGRTTCVDASGPTRALPAKWRPCTTKHKNRTTTVTTENAAAEKSQSIDQFKGMLQDFVCLLLFPTTASRSCPSTLPTQRCFGKKGGTWTKSTKVGSPASRGGHKHPASIREIRCSFSRTSGSRGKCPSSRVRKKMQPFYLLGLHIHGIHPYKISIWIYCVLWLRKTLERIRAHMQHILMQVMILYSINMHPWSGVWGMVVWKLSAWAKASLLQSGPSGRADSGALVLKIMTVRVG